MEVEFMTADTTLPPCMPLPRAMLRLPISSTAKVMYARMLDIVFLSGIEDTNGILFKMCIRDSTVARCFRQALYGQPKTLSEYLYLG